MRAPIRVALLATIVDFGGIERVLLTLLQHMGSPIEIVPILFTRTDTQERSFFDSLRRLGVPHEMIYVNTSRAKYWNPVRNIRQANALIRRQRFDLIHSHGYRADLIGLVAAKRFGLPLVSTCHGFISTDSHLSFYRHLDIFLLRYFTRVIAVSGRMKDDLIGRGVAAAKIDVITNAVADVATPHQANSRKETRSRLGIGNEEFVFGFVGRLSEEKGVEQLVEAARGLAAGTRACRLLIVGDGPRRAPLERTVRDLGLSSRVDFVGFQSDTSAWYPAMDAFVLPSLTEGTPMALLEAMAHGLPVIATAVGGVPAMLSDQDNGLLVPPADPEMLLAAMQAVAADAGLRARLSDGAIRSVREAHGVGTWIDRIRDLYMATAGGASRPNDR